MPQPSSISSILFVLVLMTFALPWISFKCEAVETPPLTGLEVVMGQLNDELDEFNDSGQSFGVSDMQPYQSDQRRIELFARVAAALAAIGASLVFFRGVRSVRGQSGRQMRIALAFGGLFCLILVKFDTERLVAELVPIGGILFVNWKIGFWLACAMFVTIILYQIAQLNRYKR